MALGRLLPTAWLDSLPVWTLVLVAIICYGTPVLILIPQHWRRWLWGRLRFTPQSLGWTHVAIAASFVVFIQAAVIHQNVLSSLIASASSIPSSAWNRLVSLSKGPKGPDLSDLFTRPTCDPPDCSNFDFLVTECRLQAMEIAGKDRSLIIGTEHYRNCLIARGLSWVPCERGEPDCRLLRVFYDRDREPNPVFILVQ